MREGWRWVTWVCEGEGEAAAADVVGCVLLRVGSSEQVSGCVGRCGAVSSCVWRCGGRCNTTKIKVEELSESSR